MQTHRILTPTLAICVQQTISRNQGQGHSSSSLFSTYDLAYYTSGHSTKTCNDCVSANWDDHVEHSAVGQHFYGHCKIANAIIAHNLAHGICPPWVFRCAKPCCWSTLQWSASMIDPHQDTPAQYHGGLRCVTRTPTGSRSFLYLTIHRPSRHSESHMPVPVVHLTYLPSTTIAPLFLHRHATLNCLQCSRCSSSTTANSSMLVTWISLMTILSNHFNDSI